MLHASVRWLILVGLSGCALAGCSSDPEPATGSAGMSSTGGSSSAGTGNGGSATSAGMSSGGSAAGQSAAGTANGGSSAGNGGSGGSGGSGGAGGASGGSSGGGGAGGNTAGGTGGGGNGMPTAVAAIMGLNGKTVAGTATFTQGATMTKLVLNLTACPDGVHASHLHENMECGANGDPAGGHWINGEGLADYTCTAGKATLEVSKGIDKWTVGDGKDTDVTKHSFMVHEMGGAAPGGRIGCGSIVKQ